LGLIGGPITTTGTLSLDTALTNALYARLNSPNIFTGAQAVNGNFMVTVSTPITPSFTSLQTLNVTGNPTGDAWQVTSNTQVGQVIHSVCTDETGPDCYGLLAEGTSKGIVTIGSIGIVASSNHSGGEAADFGGDVGISGTLTKGAGAFKIDHPLDPANKYLIHSFVESPDMMNIYNGTVLLDSSGEAWITLPDWFEALNRDFRYQLTAIGVPSPNLYVAEEVSGNRFKIAGGQSGAKVSWQVTGIRHDAYADAHRLPIEEDKPEEERGYYLHPEIHGQPAEKSIFLKRLPQMRHADTQHKQP